MLSSLLKHVNFTKLATEIGITVNQSSTSMLGQEEETSRCGPSSTQAIKRSKQMIEVKSPYKPETLFLVLINHAADPVDAAVEFLRLVGVDVMPSTLDNLSMTANTCLRRNIWSILSSKLTMTREIADNVTGVIGKSLRPAHNGKWK